MSSMPWTNPALEEKREKIAARDTSMPISEPVRAVEVGLLRAIAMTSTRIGVIAEAENVFCGGGILVAYDAEGRKFKIEITQVAGPA